MNLISGAGSRALYASRRYRRRNGRSATCPSGRARSNSSRIPTLSTYLAIATNPSAGSAGRVVHKLTLRARDGGVRAPQVRPVGRRGAIDRARNAGPALEGKAAPRPGHEVGQRPSAMAAGGSGVGDVAIENGGDLSASGVGAADRVTAREASRDGRPGGGGWRGSCLRCGATEAPSVRRRSKRSSRARSDS
jgi:hypothetical protein